MAPSGMIRLRSTDSVDASLARLEAAVGHSEPAVVTAPRVMVGHRLGGVATEFVQSY